MAYKAKSDDESFRGNTRFVKICNASSKGTCEKMGETCEWQSRKAVQMNCLARHFSVSFSKAVLKVCEDFGECFNYNPVYFGKINHGCVRVLEELLPGDFQKYINNNGRYAWMIWILLKNPKLLCIIHMKNLITGWWLQIYKVLDINIAIRKLQLKP